MTDPLGLAAVLTLPTLMLFAAWLRAHPAAWHRLRRWRTRGVERGRHGTDGAVARVERR